MYHKSQTKYNIVLLLLFTTVTCFSQSQEGKKLISDLANRLRVEESDSMQVVYIDQLAKFIKVPDAKLYTTQKINNIAIPRVDALIATSIVSIDSIADRNSDLETEFVKNIDLENRPYSTFQFLFYISKYRSISEIELHEKYLKMIIDKTFRQRPLETLQLFSDYYLTSTSSVSKLNKYWSKADLQIALDFVTKSSERFAVYNVLSILNLDSITEVSKVPQASDYVIEVINTLEEELYSYRGCKRCVSVEYPLANRDLKYFQSINEQKLKQIFNQEMIDKLRKGEMAVQREMFELLNRHNLFATPSQYIDTLLTEYNRYISNISRELKEFGIECNISPITVSSFPPDDVFSRNSLNFDFINQYIASQCSGLVSNKKLFDAILNEAVVNATLAFYAIGWARDTDHVAWHTPNTHLDLRDQLQTNWERSKLKSEIASIDDLSNTVFSNGQKLYSKSLSNKVVVKSRKLDMESYRVLEDIRIKRKFWFSKRVKFIGDVPLCYRNTVKSYSKSLDVVGFSFFKREISNRYNKNHPFFELMDMIVNHETNMAPVLYSFYRSDHSHAAEFIETEVRAKIGTGVLHNLHNEIGLKVGHQKIRSVTNYLEIINSQINSSDASSGQKDLFNSSFVNPYINSRINYRTKSEIDNQKISIDQIFSICISYEANKRVYSVVNRRAHSLPIQPDCKWYEFIWCNKDRNRKMNDERARQINFSAARLNSNNTSIGKLPYFNIIGMSRAKYIVPFFNSYDSMSKSILSMSIMIDESGNKYVLAAKDSLKANVAMEKVDLFWRTYDPDYLSRYQVDLSNVSDHGYEYFAKVSEAFIKENMTNNGVARRLTDQGFTKNYDLTPDDFGDIGYENELTNNLRLKSYFLVAERKLIRLLSAEMAEILVEPREKILENRNLVENSINNAIAPAISQVNSGFDRAMDQWNEWSIFIGFTTVGNTTIPIIAFNSGSVNVNIGILLSGTIPVIPLPRGAFNPF